MHIFFFNLTHLPGMEEDQDSLFGSPPPSPRIPSATLSLPSASICDNERRLSTSTDTQNVGTIALPGSHLYSELPLNPLALSLNHITVHRPPAQSQDQPTSAAKQSIQPWQPPPPAQNSGSENSRSSQSPFSNVPPRDPEFSLPDPSAPPPAHFLRNQQNLLGKAGLVAGVKPSTIAHIRGTSFNPIVIDEEDTPILGRQSRDSRNNYADPSLLTAPTNEDIVSVLIGQKDIFPVLNGILDIIGKKSTRPTPTPTTSFFTRNDPSKQPPIKRRRLIRVPAGATDWDVPYPFQEGEGPDEYHKTWERKRAKDLVTQLVKLIKLAARKAAIKNHLRKEGARQAIWEKLVKTEPQNQPSPPPSQVSFDSIISSLVAAQSSLTSSQASTPGLGDFTLMDNNFDNSGGESSSASNTAAAAAVPDDLEALIASMLNSLPQDQGFGTTPVPTSSSSSQPSLIGDDAIDPALLALSVQPGSDENLTMSQAVSPVPSMGSSSSSGAGPMTPTSSAWDPDIFTGFSQGVFRPTLWNDFFSQGAYQGFAEGGGWDEIGQITGDFLSGMAEEGNMAPMVGGEEGKGKEKEVDPLGFSSADATIPTQENTLMGTQSTDDIVLPPSYEQPEHHPTPVPATPGPKNTTTTTISQSRKQEILKRAREKRRQVQEDLDSVKTQLWETTIEQAALVHLLKRYENDDQDGSSSS
jgi:hypothetical protein